VEVIILEQDMIQAGPVRMAYGEHRVPHSKVRPLPGDQKVDPSAVPGLVGGRA
jgi:hypothetical protein